MIRWRYLIFWYLVGAVVTVLGAVSDILYRTSFAGVGVVICLAASVKNGRLLHDALLRSNDSLVLQHLREHLASRVGTSKVDEAVKEISE